MKDYSETILASESEGTKISIFCNNCQHNTNHTIQKEYVFHRTEELDDNFSISGGENAQIIQCDGCRCISFKSESWCSEDDPEESPRVKIFPEKEKGKQLSFFDTNKYPESVARIYKETVAAANSKLNVLATIGIRSIIEAICKTNGSHLRLLDKMIDQLSEKKLITASGTMILQALRRSGNDAAHEVTPLTNQQVWCAIEVIEHLLKEQYIIPAEIKKHGIVKDGNK